MVKRPETNAATLCDCGSYDDFEDCCGRYLAAGQTCATAEALMRSRYTAFVRGDEAYLLATWHPETRPSRVRLDDRQRWLGLQVRATEGGGEDDLAGTVEFVARYKVDGRGTRLHEVSRFERLEDRWFYRDGQHL